MANTSAFQAEDAGSIPVVPSLITSADYGGGDFALVGERGSGGEVVASVLRSTSLRAEPRFIVI